MNSDSKIKSDVEAELRWAPEVDEGTLSVKVSGGVVTLLGFAKTSFESYRAERAARRVKGVAAIANDIEVHPADGHPTDTEIAKASVVALRMELPAVCKDIQTTVRQGHVTLLGHVEWHYQRELAELIVHRVNGVLGVRNSIVLKPKTRVEKNIRQDIEAAFKRLAQIDAARIAVEAAGSEITLRGEVRSWAEHDQAQATAWSAPGVTSVRNELVVRS